MTATSVFHKTPIFYLVWALLFSFTDLKTFAGAGGVDTTFNVIVNNTVYSTLVQPDGKILIGGSFSAVQGVQRSGLTRVFPDGTVDTNFLNSVIGAQGIFALARQADGKLLVGGNFNFFVSPFQRQNIVRLNVDGSLDGTFTNSAPNNAVNAIAVQSDGKILIGGLFNTVGNTNHYYVARLNTDGTVDNSFNAGIISGNMVNAIAVQSDGNILIGGSFGFFSTYGLTRNNIARLSTNGVPDITYQPNASGTVQAVYLQNDGKSVWGGFFTVLNSNSRGHVGRLNVDGSLDASFTATAGVNNTVYAVTEDTNNNIYVAGLFNEYNNVVREGIARVFSDGTLDSTFNNTTNFAPPQMRCVAIQGDGKVLAGGNFFTFNSVPRTNFIRLYGDLYPAEISTQPQSQNAALGTNVTFSVDVRNPTPVQYQWRKDGVNLPGANFNEYSIFNVQMADAGNYSVLVTSGLGGMTSSNALLQVGIPPAITQQPMPTSLTVTQGQTATFTAAASGTPLNYYWKLGQAVVGTNATLTLTNATISQSGSYVLVVSNFLGKVTSAQVSLTVLAPITTVSGPTPSQLSVLVGSTASFSVFADGYPQNYEWLKNGNPIQGAANASNYTLNSAALTDSGGYSVIVSNQFGSITSSVANLSVGIPPQMLQIHLNSSNFPVVQMPGTPGFNYTLQTATNLTPPVVWTPLTNVPTDTNGVWSYTDTNQPVTGGLFYRVTSP